MSENENPESIDVPRPASARVWLTATTARVLRELAVGASVEVSLDLGRTTVCVTRAPTGLRDPHGHLSEEDLEHIVDHAHRVYVSDGDGYRPVEVRVQRFVTLRPTEDAPAMMLDGILMHLMTHITPWESTRQMAAAVKPKRRRVLDTCGGMGYAAIHAARLGARAVTTLERCPEVIRLREDNPWSRELRDDPAITPVIADVRHWIRDCPAESFDAIIHDPPRLGRRTGDLYGRPFYEQLYRVLTPRGRLLHYLGRPRQQGGAPSTARVPQRLQQLGFGQLRHHRELLSVTLVKPG